MAHPQTFLDRLGLQFPIIQAPMAGVTTPQLAAAVSNAGGLGSLGLSHNSVAQMRQAITATQTLTHKPFNVNLFCHTPPPRDAQRDAAWLARLQPLFDEIGLTPPSVLNEVHTSLRTNDDALALLLETRPAVVSFHFGLPQTEKIQALHAAGIVTIASATNLAEAQQIEAAGVDAIVAMGIEAGGHRGTFDPTAPDERYSTAVLTRLLVQGTQRPIIAAGGIMDGRGVKAMLDLGAVAAQLGTAFILCPESAANAAYRAALKSERAAHTCLTDTISGRPARGMVNRFIRFCERPGGVPPAAFSVAYDAAKQLATAAAQQGNHEFTAHWAGQAAPLARELPAAQLVANLAQEIAV